jgi:hypothetical protein
MALKHYCSSKFDKQKALKHDRSSKFNQQMALKQVGSSKFNRHMALSTRNLPYCEKVRPICLLLPRMHELETVAT